ncbi:uncharacterized protein LOC116619226 [Nematostella vectensis]|uniref:uncharacterized protein LOC116619226 n=1 Tax=Nematostella vectensis TaxID=45351 RepID=UPI0013903F54|nr:uncharacterized protein LOC116619226 [Nematostella vectensis]
MPSLTLCLLACVTFLSSFSHGAQIHQHGYVKPLNRGSSEINYCTWGDILLRYKTSNMKSNASATPQGSATENGTLVENAISPRKPLESNVMLPPAYKTKTQQKTSGVSSQNNLFRTAGSGNNISYMELSTTTKPRPHKNADDDRSAHSYLDAFIDDSWRVDGDIALSEGMRVEKSMDQKGSAAHSVRQNVEINTQQKIAQVTTNTTEQKIDKTPANTKAQTTVVAKYLEKDVNSSWWYSGLVKSPVVLWEVMENVQDIWTRITDPDERWTEYIYRNFKEGLKVRHQMRARPPRVHLRDYIQRPRHTLATLSCVLIITLAVYAARRFFLWRKQRFPPFVHRRGKKRRRKLSSFYIFVDLLVWIGQNLHLINSKNN